jgi:hypothetical protein
MHDYYVINHPVVGDSISNQRSAAALSFAALSQGPATIFNSTSRRQMARAKSSCVRPAALMRPT